MSVAAVLFDIDGTLVDSNAQHVEVWERVLREAGFACDRATIHAQIGKGADQLLPALIPEAEAALRERLAAAHGAMFEAEYLGAVRPFAGAHDLLAAVHAAGQRVVLASSASAAEVDHHLDLLDARDLVTATTSADDVAHTKPAPDIFAAALAKLAPLTADAVVVVGDTPHDIAAAQGCGIATVAVRSGGFDDARLAGAVSVYNDVGALLADYPRSPLAARG